MESIPRRAQEGPWSVSVAETPHDARAYSLYIKTPTHNLTLTRTAMEILDLDAKLREHDHQAKIPVLPFTPDSLPPPPPKRKSNFLNTLSRLASPSSNKTARRNPNALPTPIASPKGEINDPFLSFGPSNVNSPSVVATPSATSTGLAAYLTTISNSPTLRQTRVWKRFVRVRTDDLESVRPERAIKRVRSDLAAHVGGLPGQKDDEGAVPGSTDDDMPVEDSLPTPVQSPKELDEGDDVRPEPDPIIQDEVNKNQDSIGLLSEAEAPAPLSPEDIPVPTTPTTTEAQDEAQAQAAAPSQQRIHRSQSADPEKSSRISRAFAQSTPATSPTTTTITATTGAAPIEIDPGSISSATGDESSVSIATSKRKKRSKSRTPREKKLKDKEPKKSQRKAVINDFEMMRVLGKGCAGKVLLVRQKTTSELYALKAITKRHVLAHQELQHTLTEQAVLKRMAAEGKDPFVVKLWWSFHDKENLFLVMDFHPGGDLATQLARWGRLGRDRARFYAAEIVEGVEGLHNAGVIYRDLKPENILIGADGHIVLTDFGLSKEFPRRPSTAGSASVTGTPQMEITASAAWISNPHSPAIPTDAGGGQGNNGWPGQGLGLQDQTTTFCGTAEYLAPEVIQGLPYSYEVDWWSFGTMLYEMLTGITPFWANNHSDMYVRVLQDELQFPEDRAIDQDTKSLIRGLLQRNPGLRICEPRIKRHPYFSMIDWSHVYHKRYIPPYIPPIDPSNASDTQNFDDTFLDMEPILDEYQDDQDAEQQEREQDQGQTTDTDGDVHTDTDRTTGTETEDGEEDTATTPSQSRSSSMRRPLHQQQSQVISNSVVVQAGEEGEKKQEESTVDVFDGYSFKGRHSVLIDSSDEEEEDEEDEEDEIDEEEGSGSERTGITSDAGLTANTTTSTTMTTTTTESSDVGDDSSSVLGSIASPETARPTSVDEEVVAEVAKDRKQDVAEPKTPEARHINLPPQPPVVPIAPPVVVPVSVITDTKAEAASGMVNEGDDIEKLVATAKELEHRLEEGEPKTPTEDQLKDVLPSTQPPSTSSQQQKSITTVPIPANIKLKHQRRERSGIPALDEDLPEDTEAGEDTEAAGEYDDDDEDDDWDFIDAVDGEDRNGAKGTSLFARGVVDRYRLAVFSRKASTPSKSSSASVSGAGAGQSTSQRQSRQHQGQGGQQQQQRATLNKMSPKSVLDEKTNGGSESPTQKRGRTALSFTRKGTRQFLQPKNVNTVSPVSSGSGSGNGSRGVSTPAKSKKNSSSLFDNQQLSALSKKGIRKSFGPLSTTLLSSQSHSQSQSNSNYNPNSNSNSKRNSSNPTASSPHAISSSSAATATTATTVGGLLTPSMSMRSSAVISWSPSLKSRESAVSVGVAGMESDQSFGPVGVVTSANAGGELGEQRRVYSGDESVVGNGGGGGVNLFGGGSGDKTKTTKKLKKYKEGAEKVFSLFSGATSPKQHHAS